MAGVNVFVGPREGDWHSIAHQYPAAPVRDNVLQILAKHGKPGEPAGWAILFGATAKDLDAVIRTPHWKVLRNDRGCQSLQFRSAMQMASFFEAGKIGGNSGLTVDKPCLVMGTPDRLWVGDPTLKGLAVAIHWRQGDYSLKLPGGGKTAQLPPPDAAVRN